LPGACDLSAPRSPRLNCSTAASGFARKRGIRTRLWKRVVDFDHASSFKHLVNGNRAEPIYLTPNLWASLCSYLDSRLSIQLRPDCGAVVALEQLIVRRWYCFLDRATPGLMDYTSYSIVILASVGEQSKQAKP